MASRCRSVTSRGGTSRALVPCSPPPCTAATLRISPVADPRGAIAASTTTTAITPSPIAACGAERTERPSPAVDRATWRPMSTSDMPSWNTTQVSRITPPTRTTPTSGPPTCDMPIVARGTPPNGNENRSASASVCAAGRPITRHDPTGATSSARRWKQANTAAATKYPGSVSCTIQAIPRYIHPAPKRKPSSIRWRRDGASPSATSNSITPTIARGQKPHGGIDSATSVPAPSASAGRAIRSRTGRRSVGSDPSSGSIWLKSKERDSRRSASPSSRVGGRRTGWQSEWAWGS